MDRTSFSEKKLPETVPPLRNRYEHLANHQRHRFFDHDLSVIPNRPQSQTRAGLAGNRHDILNIGGFSDQVFTLIGSFAEQGMGANFWVEEIEKTELVAVN